MYTEMQSTIVVNRSRPHNAHHESSPDPTPGPEPGDRTGTTTNNPVEQSLVTRHLSMTYNTFLMTTI